MVGVISVIITENIYTVVLKAPFILLAVPNFPIPFSHQIEEFAIP
jgi:hypothetical protein